MQEVKQNPEGQVDQRDGMDGVSKAEEKRRSPLEWEPENKPNERIT
jgi:hypothetical protein